MHCIPDISYVHHVFILCVKRNEVVIYVLPYLIFLKPISLMNFLSLSMHWHMNRTNYFFYLETQLVGLVCSGWNDEGQALATAQ